jgi:hypothetical protein
MQRVQRVSERKLTEEDGFIVRHGAKERDPVVGRAPNFEAVEMKRRHLRAGMRRDQRRR